MNIDVANAVAAVLLESGSVILPGLGEFSGTPQSAIVDYVKGVIAPPSQRLEFNSNLVLNDGVLLNHLQKHYDITAEHALTAVETFVNEATEKLNKREILTIPKVGRLYSDFEKNIHFLPEEGFINPDTFGLPEVQLSPALSKSAQPIREKAEISAIPVESIPRYTAIQAATVTDVSKPIVGVPKKQNSRKWIPWAVVCAAGLLAFVTWYFLGQDKTAKQENTNVISYQNTETAASETATTTFNSIDTAENKPVSPEQNIEPSQTQVSTPNPVTATGPGECIIIIHSFGVQKNARKFADRLKADGYEPKIKMEGPLHRVGILFNYSNRAEVQRMINKLGAKYDAGPVVFGEEETMQ
jgi:hypothetical protein